MDALFLLYRVDRIIDNQRVIRVLVVMTAREAGGVSFSVERLLKLLAGRFDFTLVMPEGRGLAGMRVRLEQSVRIHCFPFDGFFSTLAPMGRLKRLAAEHDVVHLNSNHPASRVGILLAWALGGSAPALTVEHSGTDMTALDLPLGHSRFLPLLFRLSRLRVRKVIGVSRQNCWFLSSYYRIPETKVQLVYNGIPVAEFTRCSPRNRVDLRLQLGLSLDNKIVLVVAASTRNKGHR